MQKVIAETNFCLLEIVERGERDEEEQKAFDKRVNALREKIERDFENTKWYGPAKSWGLQSWEEKRAEERRYCAMVRIEDFILESKTPGFCEETNPYEHVRSLEDIKAVFEKDREFVRKTFVCRGDIEGRVICASDMDLCDEGLELKKLPPYLNETIYTACHDGCNHSNNTVSFCYTRGIDPINQLRTIHEFVLHRLMWCRQRCAAIATLWDFAQRIVRAGTLSQAAAETEIYRVPNMCILGNSAKLVLAVMVARLRDAADESF